MANVEHSNAVRQTATKYDGIQVLRAAAALFVVIWHLEDVGRQFAGVNLNASELLRFGYGGVDLFFVVSGFIICHVSLARPFNWRDFLAKRFLRIYPLYAFFTLVAVLVFCVDPSWLFHVGEPSLLQVVQSLFILPQKGWPTLFVGWSLEHEVLFYILAGIHFSWGQVRLLPFVLIVLFLIGVVSSLVLDLQWDWQLFSPYQLEFAFGVFIFLQRKRVEFLGCAVPFATGMILLSMTGAWDDPDSGGIILGQARLVRVIGFGLAGSFLLISAINAKFDANSWVAVCAVRLGDASYTLYLMHPFVLYSFAKAGRYFEVQGTSAYMLLGTAFAATCLVAWAFYEIIERPFLKGAWHRQFRNAAANNEISAK